VLREGLLARGYTEVDEDQAASLFIINTCTVTERATREAFQEIRRLARLNPSAEFVVTGCAAELYRKEFLKLPGVVRIIPQKEKIDIAQGISYLKGHTRAFLKIQDGCDLECSFCIVPKVRGGSVSRRPWEVIQEAKRLVGRGYKEIVLAGIHLGSYGKDLSEGGSMLCSVVRGISQIHGLGRIRVSSLEIHEVEPGLLKEMRDGKLCPHLHIPLQSGSDFILHSMRRRYTVKQYRKAIEAIREYVPEIAITTDIIVGFPGEGIKEFNQTLELVNELRFSRIHVFPYSRREGTQAAMIPKTVSAEEKKVRSRILRDLAKELAFGYHSRFVGKRVQILIEERKDEYFSGYTERYIPVRLRGAWLSIGSLVNARVISATPAYVEAEAE
jgi:threonylcarbamoyladenosine tRNA methylthiotransferase MtaB